MNSSETSAAGKNRECPGICPKLEQTDTTERLGPDDQATQREQQFRQAALIRQQQAHALAQARLTPGVCANCQAACLPLACYCDEDCRDDHQRRQLVRRRQGLPEGGARGA